MQDIKTTSIKLLQLFSTQIIVSKSKKGVLLSNLQYIETYLNRTVTKFEIKRRKT